jgi:hypothetical protein
MRLVGRCRTQADVLSFVGACTLELAYNPGKSFRYALRS